MEGATLKPWQTLSRRELVNGRPWLRLMAEDIQLPDGRIVRDFYTIEAPDYVMIVALTADTKAAIVERSYKHGPGRVSLTLPAGYIEPGEEPATAARRELLEETGHAADSWQHLGTFTVDGNRGCGAAHIYLARDARRTAAPDAGDLEEMEIHFLTLPALRAALFRGDVAQLPVVAAIGMATIALDSERAGL
jgi:ADP-ribose pyrophosphatase